MAAGRTTEPRTATINTTSTSTAITGDAGTFHEEDAGRTITGTGIPTGATLASVQSDTAATLTAAATATGSPTATLGPANAQTYGFHGWSPETDAESEAYTVAASQAGVIPPGVITDPHTQVQQRGRS